VNLSEVAEQSVATIFQLTPRFQRALVRVVYNQGIARLF
jgi:hypothetical protein